MLCSNLKNIYYKFVNFYIYGNFYSNLFNIKIYCLNRCVFNPPNLIDYNDTKVSDHIIYEYNFNKNDNIIDNINIIYINSLINCYDNNDEILKFNISKFYNCYLNVIKTHNKIFSFTFLNYYRFINLKIIVCKTKIKKCNLKQISCIKYNQMIYGHPYYMSFRELLDK